jgi:hypothetical protein
MGEMSATTPERLMVRKALVPGALAVPIAYGAGLLLAGAGPAASAAIGAFVVLGNFAVHGLSLAWASRVSIPAVHAVALGGAIVRLGVIVATMFALAATEWFSPVAFGLAVVPGTVALLVYEARLVARGLGGALQIPPDPAAARAAEALAAREASGW